MATLNLTLPDGRSAAVQVDDSFNGLSSDQQNDTVDEIVSSLSTKPDSIFGDLKGGVHDLGTSISQGLNVAGGVMSRNGMPNWGGDVSSAGQWVQGHTPDAPVGFSPSDEVAADLRNHNWSDLPGHLLHAAVRAAPSAIPVIGAGLAGGPVGAGAAAAALAEGPEAYQRAANNGRSQPTTADDLEAIPGAAVSGVGGALIPGESKIASAVGRGVFRAGKEALGGAVMSTGSQLGGSVGTDKGAQFDPYQTAGAALTQGAIGAGRSVPDIGRAAAGGASDAVMSRVAVPAPANDPEAQSQARVGQMYQEAQAADPRSSSTQVLNNLKSTVALRAVQTATDLASVGLLSSDTLRTARTVIDQAQRHNNTIGSYDPTSYSLLMHDLSTSGVPEQALTPLLNGIQDLNTLAPTSFLKNQTGPFTALAGGIGKVAGAAAPFGFGSHIPARLAAPIGGVVDNVLGLSTPKILLQSKAANRYLTAKNLLAGPNSLDAMQDVRDAVAAQPTIAQQQADKLKQAQMAAGYAQNNQFRNQVDDAYQQNQPAAPQVNAYMNGNLNDPSLLPGNKLTPAQELALQSQRLRNQQLQQAQQTAQGTLFSKVAGADTDSQGQTALDKLAQRNAAILAAAQQTPSARPDVPEDANEAAMQAMQRRAKGMLGQIDDSATVGNPPTPIPVNTPIPAATPTPAAAPAQSSLPPLRIDTAQTVRNALDEADKQLGKPATHSGFTPASGYIARNFPGATHADVVTKAKAAEAAGIVPAGTADLVNTSPAGLDAKRFLLPIIAHGLMNLPSPGGTGDQSGVRRALAYAHNLKQEASIANNIVVQHPELMGVVNQIRDPVRNGKTSAGRMAIAVDYVSKLPTNQQAATMQILAPLTAFGQK